jgi:NADPH:quinone reductase-like Zn-dependent oxidoreductase
MKAIVRDRYGSPDVLQLKDTEKPTPSADQILVKIKAASINPADYHNMRGGIIRLFGEGFTKPKDPKFGIDYSGIVEAKGATVTRFRPGDEVFGSCSGSLAEYACAREIRSVLKPSNISFEEAAAVPVAGITALQALRDKGKIQTGQKVLVNGSSGGVGTFAVQIAKSFGAEVTGVCSSRNLEQTSSLGALHVIDYSKEDFTSNGLSYDLICDVASNHSVSSCKRVLNSPGICVVVGFSSFPRLFEHLVLGPLESTGKKKIGFMGIAKINEKDLLFLKDLLESGKVKPVIDRRYPLSETSEAVRYLEEKHARGKVVITIDQNN